MPSPTRSYSLHVTPRNCRYQAMIGVGGIGSGTFFALRGDHTLGREESRGGRFLDRRDYCKLHIVSHYVKIMLGPEFSTIPIGRVGDDDTGHKLMEEMRDAGLELQYVRCAPGEQTLFSFCFVYPDGSGGNLTTDDSACARVDAPFVAQAEPEFARFAGQGIALAAPEVPISARHKLLQLGTQYRFLRVASFVAEEMHFAIDMGMLKQTDLLAINLNEAAAVSTTLSDGAPRSTVPLEVVKMTVEKLRNIKPTLLISITGGKKGSWTWDGESLLYMPAFPAAVVSTAGAGDAHMAGILVGLAAGLAMSEAHQLGALTAALSVTSPHTINKGIDRRSLQAFAASIQTPLRAAVMNLLAD